MVFGVIKRAFKSGANEIKADYSENKDFLEAICAASALVAIADGDLEESERRKVVSVVTNHAKLSQFYQQNVIEQTTETMFKRAKDRSGRIQLYRELDDIKSRPGAAQMAEDIFAVALDIAEADGEIEPEEEEVLKKIAERIGVDPSKFDV